MASFETLLKLREHPEWIWPRSDTRVFLGEPGGPEGAKTTVEPGNSFSPGMCSYGVTWWIRFGEEDIFFSPDEAGLDDLAWSFEEGYLPVIHCVTTVNGIEIHHELFQDGTKKEQSESAAAKLKLTNKKDSVSKMEVYLVLRSIGPAGGPVNSVIVGADRRSLWMEERRNPMIGADLLPEAIGCGVGDPSGDARRGKIPGEDSAEDPEGWCFGIMKFQVRLDPGGVWTLRSDCPLRSFGVIPEELPGRQNYSPEAYEERKERHLAYWRTWFEDIKVSTPDRAFNEAFYANLQHMLAAMVGDQIRLAPMAYPLPWMRDSVAIMRCLDLAGYHKLAEKASEICVRQDFFGGFCAEADSPGQAVWALVEHYRITKDIDWLRRVYPSVQRKCDWILKMKNAREPIQIVLDTPVLPFMQGYRNAGTICLPAKDGIIMGVMDLHIREGETNQWCICGLQEAAYAARELGFLPDAESFEQEADELKTALERYMEREPRFFEWERNVNSLIWPTRTWEYETEKVEDGFKKWWKVERGTESTYIPERFWIHFELGQIHNALMLGLREQSWQGLKYRLENQDVPGLYGWREYGGGFEEAGNAVNGVSIIKQLRGCTKFDKITPHGWCSAEMWLLQRGMLVEEWRNGLNLFAGVPDEWLKPSAEISFSGFATWYGNVSAKLVCDSRGKIESAAADGILYGTTVRLMFKDGIIELKADREGRIFWEK